MNKEKIIMVTLELACEHGLRSISMSQIAEKAGIKKSSLYSHFSSKEEIISEMYAFLRKQANHNREIGQFDYGSFVEGKNLKQILMDTVLSYEKMNQNPRMEMFYKVIISEKTLNPVAAEIMVAETNTMIWATKQLFYAVMAKRVAYFENIDSAAISFAMGVHAILDFRMDDGMAGSHQSKGILEQYIDEFCRVYAGETHTDR
ncbi:MAG: TetR/AcrR family transcriptional regulator [bacterium]|nr:TetR/AcrR family transcriptional regulator [bacterium]